jgi:hypothetical protein
MREVWEGLGSAANPSAYMPQGQDVVEQLIYGLGWRVTGAHGPVDNGEGNGELDVDDGAVAERSPRGREQGASSNIRASAGVVTRSVVVTSPDPRGIKFVVTCTLGPTADDDATTTPKRTATEPDEISYLHFCGDNLQRFRGAHAGRQGIAVLGFALPKVADNVGAANSGLLWCADFL